MPYLELLVAFLVVVCVGVFPVDRVEGGDLTRGETSLKSVFEEIELVRCLFEEGRLVVRHKGELKTLRSGDQWPEAGLRVFKADDGGIVMATMESDVLPSGQAVPRGMVILSRGLEGQVRVQTFNSESPEKPIVFELPEAVSVP